MSFHIGVDAQCYFLTFSLFYKLTPNNRPVALKYFGFGDRHICRDANNPKMEKNTEIPVFYYWQNQIRIFVGPLQDRVFQKSESQSDCMNQCL